MPFEKLVGSKVEGNLLAKGLRTFVRRPASPREYDIFLWGKNWEEAGEFLDANTIQDLIDESGDVLEVLETILRMNGMTKQDIVSLFVREPLPATVDSDELKSRFFYALDDFSVAPTEQELIASAATMVACMRSLLLCNAVPFDEALEAQRRKYEIRGGFEYEHANIMLMESPGRAVTVPVAA